LLDSVVIVFLCVFVRRFNDIVQHQLGRAITPGRPRFTPPLLVAPIARAHSGALAKVYAEGACLQRRVPG
jgi:hypothetical protein